MGWSKCAEDNYEGLSDRIRDDLQRSRLPSAYQISSADAICFTCRRELRQQLDSKNRKEVR